MTTIVRKVLSVDGTGIPNMSVVSSMSKDLFPPIRLPALRRKKTLSFFDEARPLDKLMLIRKLKDMGFTLNEIDTFLELWREEDASCTNLKFTLENKLVIVDEQMQNLAELKSRLSQSLTKCNNDDCEFEKTIPSCLCQ